MRSPQSLAIETVEYLKQFVGVPYLWGGNNPVVGFDCSGLICEGLKFAGLLRGATDLSARGIFSTFEPKSEVPPLPYPVGTLLFFGRSPSIMHVAIVSGDGLMLEAGGGNASTTSVEAAGIRNAFVRQRPIASRSDLVIGLFPPYGESLA